MTLEIAEKDGGPRPVQISGSWTPDRRPNGHHAARLFLIQDDGQRKAVVAWAEVEFPNREVGKILANTFIEMLNRMPPDIVAPPAGFDGKH